MPGSNEYSMAPELRSGASGTSKAASALASITKKKTTPMPNFALSVPLSRPASIMSEVDMNLNYELGKMSDEQKAQIVNLAKSLTTKPKWSATNASVNAGATTYKVQAGNTLGQIVADYNKKNGTALKWQDVAKWSGIADPSKMKIGHVINFADPAAQKIEQKPGQTVDKNTEKNTDPKISLPGGNTKPSIDSLGINSPTDSTGLAVVDSLAANNGLVAPQLDSAAIAAALDSADVLIVDILKAAGAPSTNARTSFDLASMMTNRGWKPTTIQIPKFQYSTFNKQGGTMNRINYFQQGGSAQANSSDAFMQAILQGDPLAVQQLVQEAANGNKQAEDLIKAILEGAQKGNQLVMKAAQAIATVVQQAQGQATAAKWGAKLGYIRSLKYAKGGKTCPTCEIAAKVEMKKCGGKKSKRK